MIPLSALLVAQALEEAMPLKPRPKAKEIPIGNFDVIRDVAGKATIKPKRKPRALPQEIASRKKRRFKGVAK